MKLKITKEVFEFVELPNSAAAVYSIRIRKGRYKNVIYKYGQVKFTEEDEQKLRQAMQLKKTDN